MIKFLLNIYILIKIGSYSALCSYSYSILTRYAQNVPEMIKVLLNINILIKIGVICNIMPMQLQHSYWIRPKRTRNDKISFKYEKEIKVE